MSWLNALLAGIGGGIEGDARKRAREEQQAKEEREFKFRQDQINYGRGRDTLMDARYNYGQETGEIDPERAEGYRKAGLPMEGALKLVKGRGVGAVPLPNLPGFRLPEMPTELPADASDLIENAPTPMASPVAGATLGGVKDTFSKPETEQQKRVRVAAASEVQMLEQLAANENLRPEIRPVIQRALALAKSGQPSGMTETDVLALLRPVADPEAMTPEDAADASEATGRTITKWSDLKPGEKSKWESWKQRFRGVDRPGGGTGTAVPEGLTTRDRVDYQQALGKLAARPEIKDYREMSRYVGALDEAMKESTSGGNMVAVDQALINAFNKLMDPTSVVRESEYARTANDLSILNRLRGKLGPDGKLAVGGAGLTRDDREAIARMARSFSAASERRSVEARDEVASMYDVITTSSGTTIGDMLRKGWAPKKEAVPEPEADFDLSGDAPVSLGTKPVGGQAAGSQFLMKSGKR